jgi:ribosomal protein L4
VNLFIQLLVFEDLEVPTHKTKNFLNYFKQLEDTKKLLIVDGGPINEKLKLATQNLHYVNLLPAIVSISSTHVASIIFLMEVIIITPTNRHLLGMFGWRVLEGRAYVSFLNYGHYKMFIKIN